MSESTGASESTSEATANEGTDLDQTLDQNGSTEEASQPDPNPGKEDLKDQGENPWEDPEKARREIERLRRENGDARINAKKTAAEEARQDLLKTLTLALDPESAQKEKPLSIEEVSAKLNEASSARDQALFDSKFISEAWKQGINPEKMDYLRFVISRSDTLKSSSPTDEAFGAILESTIAEAVGKDSSLKSVGTAPVSGAETFSGSESGATITKAEFDKMTYSQRAELYKTDRSTYDRLNAER